MSVKAGDPAPDFQLKDETSNAHTLTEFRGKKVVLYFYPKDDTPGCTTEVCNFRDGYSKVQELELLFWVSVMIHPNPTKNSKKNISYRSFY